MRRFVTILTNRATYHVAMLSQTVTPDNIVLHRMLANTQSFIAQQGGTVAQAQAAATTLLQRYLGVTAATMAVDDVFRVAALISLLAVVPALFLRSQNAGGGRAPTAMVE